MDEAFGPAFVKVCAYFPYPIKIWLNEHDYAKRRGLRLLVDRLNDRFVYSCLLSVAPKATTPPAD